MRFKRLTHLTAATAAALAFGVACDDNGGQDGPDQPAPVAPGDGTGGTGDGTGGTGGGTGGTGGLGDGTDGTGGDGTGDDTGTGG